MRYTGLISLSALILVLTCHTGCRSRSNSTPAAAGKDAMAPVPSPPDSQPPAPEVTTAPKDAASEPVQASGPAEPQAPRLQSLIRALEARKKGEIFTVRDELAKHITGFADSENAKSVPQEASVEVFTVSRDVPLMAFVRVIPRDYKPCADDSGANADVYALFISKNDDDREQIVFSNFDFSASDTGLFAGKQPKVVFPAIAKQVPVFEIHYEPDPDRRPDCEQESDGTETIGRVVEVYHLTSAERVGDGPFVLDLSKDEPGLEGSTRAKLTWIESKARDAAFLVQSKVDEEVTHPCTGEPDDTSEECQPQYECTKTVEVVAKVTAEGSEGPEQELVELQRGEPGLARFKPGGTGNTAAACKRLTP